MSAKVLMVLGSMSSVGKSMLVTGLCRLYSRRGWLVSPFKAQNMSNNAAVCFGGEIGRAQATQAYAAGIDPSVEMNPILLKPEADTRSQVILRGQVWNTLDAIDYYAQKKILWNTVTASLDALLGENELVLIEGAGSPAELNLHDHDLVNLAVARYSQSPCLLVGDIDHGGIFAQLLGTLQLMQPTDRALVKALIINKFRGEINLFEKGIRIIENLGEKPILGVVPYLKDHAIPYEDAASISEEPPVTNGLLDIAVIHFPHISNFDDFDPLKFESGVHLRFVRKVQQLGIPNVVFLPGTKNTIGDLKWLFESGLAEVIQMMAKNGVVIIGFCGGFQMMGLEVKDDLQLESSNKIISSLKLLPVRTKMNLKKIVTRSIARICIKNGFFNSIFEDQIVGYEIHLGQTESLSPLLEITNRENQIVSIFDGACSLDGKIWGCHLHGIFENDNFRSAWLKSLNVHPAKTPFKQLRQQSFDSLADLLETSLDISRLDRIIEKKL